MVLKKIFVFFLSFLLFTTLTYAQPTPLFEGYMKIVSGGVPIGYAIQRYQQDVKNKLLLSTYFLKTNALGGNVTETLKASARLDTLRPVSYNFNSIVGRDKNQTIKSIDATFSDTHMQASVNNNGKPERIDIAFPKNTYLSTFLVYILLSAKKENSSGQKETSGLQTGLKYSYRAIAEEMGQIFDGTAFIKEVETYKNLDVFKILNTFKEERFVSYVTAKGEALHTKSPTKSIYTELVANPAEATKGFQINPNTLRLLFGDVPSGTINALSQQSQKKYKKDSTHQDISPDANKKQGIPPGKGIILKGNPKPKNK